MHTFLYIHSLYHSSKFYSTAIFRKRFCILLQVNSILLISNAYYILVSSVWPWGHHLPLVASEVDEKIIGIKIFLLQLNLELLQNRVMSNETVARSEEPFAHQIDCTFPTVFENSASFSTEIRLMEKELI